MPMSIVVNIALIGNTFAMFFTQTDSVSSLNSRSIPPSSHLRNRCSAMTVSGGNGRIFNHFCSAWIDQTKSVTLHQHRPIALAELLKGAVATQPISPRSGAAKGLSKNLKLPKKAVSLWLELDLFTTA